MNHGIHGPHGCGTISREKAQSGGATAKTKRGLTQRRRGTRRNAEIQKEKSLRISANLCASALNLRSLRAKRDIAVQKAAQPAVFQILHALSAQLAGTRIFHAARGQLSDLEIVTSLRTQLAGNRNVELMELEKSRIHVAAYWTKVLPKKLLERKLHDAVMLARARLAQAREGLK